jgi:hypothetical protein
MEQVALVFHIDLSSVSVDTSLFTNIFAESVACNF